MNIEVVPAQCGRVREGESFRTPKEGRTRDNNEPYIIFAGQAEVPMISLANKGSKLSGSYIGCSLDKQNVKCPSNPGVETPQ
jgi:hypothetical protein